MSREQRATVTTIEVSERARIRVQVVYEPGGWNGSRDIPRGYKLSAWPEELERVDGILFAKIQAQSGSVQRVEAATRFSARRLGQLATELATDPRTIRAIDECRNWIERHLGTPAACAP